MSKTATANAGRVLAKSAVQKMDRVQRSNIYKGTAGILITVAVTIFPLLRIPAQSQQSSTF
jgi:hypothetical protein